MEAEDITTKGRVGGFWGMDPIFQRSFKHLMCLTVEQESREQSSQVY